MALSSTVRFTCSGTPSATPDAEPKLDRMSLRTTPSWLRTSGPFDPSPGYGPDVSSGMASELSLLSLDAAASVSSPEPHPASTASPAPPKRARARRRPNSGPERSVVTWSMAPMVEVRPWSHLGSGSENPGIEQRGGVGPDVAQPDHGAPAGRLVGLAPGAGAAQRLVEGLGRPVLFQDPQVQARGGRALDDHRRRLGPQPGPDAPALEVVGDG